MSTCAFDGIQSIVAPATAHRSRASYDSLRVLRLGGDYALSDLWLGADRSAHQFASRRACRRACRSWVPRPTDRTRRAWASRPTSPSSTSSSSRTQTLFTRGRRRSFGLMGLLTGQCHGNILPPAEQFYLGGSHFTRGYYSGQVPGDKALVATTELQLNTCFDLSRRPTVGRMPQRNSTCSTTGARHGITSRPIQLHDQLRRRRRAHAGHALRSRSISRAWHGSTVSQPAAGPGISPLYGGAFYWRVLVRF